MGDEGVGSFDVMSTREEEAVKETGAAKKYLHVTIIDHNPVVEGTDEESYVNLRIPLSLAESGLKMVPQSKWGSIDPALIVEMIEEGADGELISIAEEKKAISIRVE